MSSGISSSAPAGGGAAALLLGAALCGLDAGAIGYVLPAMRADTGADPLQASWLVSFYVAGTLVAIPLGGAAVRRYGGVPVFRLCAAISAIGALVALIAHDPLVIVAARLAQGVGQGPLMPVAAAIIAMHWPAERQGRLMGGISLAYGAFFLGGTILAPALLAFGWRSTFGLAAVVSVAALMMVRSHPATAAAHAPGVATRAVYFVPELAAIAALSLGTGMGQAVVIFFPTLAVQRLGVTPAAAAILMLPLVVGGVATTIAITAMLDRLGARTLLAVGALATLAGILLASLAPASRPGFLVAAGLLGIGITGLCGGPLRYAAARAVAVSEQGPAQSAVALFTNIGVLAGSMMLGMLGARGADERAALELAMGAACIIMAVTFLPVAAIHAHVRKGETRAR